MTLTADGLPALVRGDPAFAAETLGYNRAWRPDPELVVRATGPADVAAAVAFGAARGLGVAVQSTGHGLVGDLGGSLLISTRRMKGLAVDPRARTVTVQAGVVWAEVIEAARPYGLAPLNGSFPGAGVMGFTLGGGLGPMSRRYGYAADHVRSVELVTADGTFHTVSPEREPDLFWGVRGGKGNLGVATALTIGLVPVTRLYGGGIHFRGESAPEVLHAYREWIEDLPEETTTSVALLRMPEAPELPEPLRGAFVVHLRIAHLGDPRLGEALLAPMRRAGRVLIDDVRDMPYTEIASIHNDPPDPQPFWEGSSLLARLSAGSVEELLRLAGPGAELPLAMVELRHLGGAARRAPEVPNAVCGRDAEFCLLAVGDATEEAARAGARVLDALAADSTGGTLLNFQGTAFDDLHRAYSAETYSRLRELKRIHDPGNLFRFGHVVPAAGEDR
ncbi:FAD-binding oxidoreductase [Rhizohabitans arisaemae]|uniref:FAD-binding oxidoreductase n=1 Tax=Rhizohabitans arisaemae TaxID=2720610 RepID=UPI0024B0F4D8|nr:FAD-binding oxidoreductase [Rhizohabitans arisaemae]